MALAVISAFALTWWSVDRIRHWAEARRVLDVPNVRSSHDQPTPRGGGLAIVTVTSSLLMLASALAGIGSSRFVLGFLLPSLLIAALSLLDDLYSLSRIPRLATHIAAAAVFSLAFGPWVELTFPSMGTLDLGWLGTPLSLLWLVGLTNIYNFMDGIDGIAGGQGAVAGLGLGCLGVWTHQPLVALAGMLLVGSCLGFLVHNWDPASIFMGDVGAAYLGFCFASLTLLGCVGNARFGFAAAATLFPFLFDSTLTLSRRLLKRENIFAAHRSHLYQRLVAGGWSHQRVSILYIGSSSLCTLAALAWYAGMPHGGLVLWAVFGIVGFGLLLVTARVASRN